MTDNDVTAQIRRLIRCGYSMGLYDTDEKRFYEWLDKVVPHPFSIESGENKGE